MNRNLTICFTSDLHGYFSDMDYAQGVPGSTGLVRCASTFPDDGNTLIMDGGDTNIVVSTNKTNTSGDGFGGKFTYTLDENLWGGVYRTVNKT